jgi:hypothetical protein
MGIYYGIYNFYTYLRYPFLIISTLCSCVKFTYKFALARAVVVLCKQQKQHHQSQTRQQHEYVTCEIAVGKSKTETMLINTVEHVSPVHRRHMLDSVDPKPFFQKFGSASSKLWPFPCPSVFASSLILLFVPIVCSPISCFDTCDLWTPLPAF